MSVLHPFRGFGELHVEARISVIKASRDAVFHRLCFGVDSTVLDAEVVGVAECEKRSELQCGG